MTSTSTDPKKVQITFIPVKQLNVVWAEAQRPYKETRAKKIAENFNIYRFDPIKVTLPNGAGIYHVVEGQHRKAAFAKVHGEDEPAPCIVIPCDDPKEAAQHFDGINGLRWRVDAVSTFKVRVTAGYPVEISVDKIVRQHGYKVGTVRESVLTTTSRHISAVTALVWVYSVNGPKVLSDVLQVLSATWQNDPNGVNGNLIRGYGTLLGEYGNKINWEILKSSVKKKYTPGSLLTIAKQNQEMHGGAMGEAVTRSLIAIYNRTVPQEKKLKRKTD
jgi:hypothetical protein